eukprot:CCRYP_016171-RA/>CCRYP_016171-RA protein AED:0.25 eAED:0.25 QI:0/0/0/1/0/0/3/0/347
MANTIGDVCSKPLFKALSDSASNMCMIKKSTLLHNLILKELSTSQDVKMPAVFDHDDCKYNIIFSTSFLSKVGIKLNYDTGLMEWYDVTLPLHPKEFDAMEDMYNIQLEDELFSEDWLQCYATHILDAKYEFTDVKDVIEHLNTQQEADMLQVLMENSKMLDGTLGICLHKKVHLELDPNAKPVHTRLYPMPCIHLSTFKNELDHLDALGMLIPQKESEWASHTFNIPKKDGQVCWISNLCQFNKWIKHKQYPLLFTTDILGKCTSNQFFTKFDIKSQDLCAIITPFDNYKYTRLAMGLKCSPDIVQATMEHVLADIEDADVYIDDIGAFSLTWEHHLDLHTILQRL